MRTYEYIFVTEENSRKSEVMFCACRKTSYLTFLLICRKLGNVGELLLLYYIIIIMTLSQNPKNDLLIIS